MKRNVLIFLLLIITLSLNGCSLSNKINPSLDGLQKDDSISEYEYSRIGNLLIKFPKDWIKKDLGNNQYTLDCFTNLSITKDSLNDMELDAYVENKLSQKNVDYTICDENTSVPHYSTTPNNTNYILVEHKIRDNNDQLKYYKQCIMEYAGEAYIISMISTTNFGISGNDDDFIKALHSVTFR